MIFAFVPGVILINWCFASETLKVGAVRVMDLIKLQKQAKITEPWADWVHMGQINQDVYLAKEGSLFLEL